jgi:hypothetical protein
MDCQNQFMYRDTHRYGKLCIVPSLPVTRNGSRQIAKKIACETRNKSPFISVEEENAIPITYQKWHFGHGFRTSRCIGFCLFPLKRKKRKFLKKTTDQDTPGIMVSLVGIQIDSK